MHVASIVLLYSESTGADRRSRYHLAEPYIALCQGTIHSDASSQDVEATLERHTTMPHKLFRKSNIKR